MQRFWLASFIVVVVLAIGGITNAQDNTYPLVFEYDDAADEFFAVVEIAVNTGDTLQVRLQGGVDVYFLVYTEQADLYEGESLDGFTVPGDGIVFLEVVSFEQASGEVTVIGSTGAAGPSPALADTGAGTVTIPSSSFVVDTCPFEVPPEVNVTCGILTVPENRLTTGDATIQLAVAIIPARSEHALTDPIIYLEGGPGGSALAGIDSWYNSPFRETRAIVVFDQRGTGFSVPSLNCPETDEGDDLGLVTACRDRLLAAGIDLTAYNSRENAADVAALRQALGYEQVNLYGISYGTRLALTVMRDYPSGIRAVVLDSVYPPNVDTNYLVTTDTYHLISLMFADCAAQSACAQAFPNLEQRFYAALDQVGADVPLVTDPESGDQYNLFPEDVIANLSAQLQRTDLVDAIPASLDALAVGDYDRYLELATFGSGIGSTLDDSTGLANELAQELLADEIEQIDQFAAQGDTEAIAAFLNELFELSPQEAQLAAQGFVELESGGVSTVEPPDIDDDSEGMNWSVQCNEELPFMSVEQALASANSVAMPAFVRDATFEISRTEFEQCAVWPAGTASAIENAPVVSAIPTLVLAARYDTATPPAWADLAAQTLSNSYTYEFPMVGHGVIDGGSCPVLIGIAFLDNPHATPDTACIVSMNTQFYIP